MNQSIRALYQEPKTGGSSIAWTATQGHPEIFRVILGF